jgi:N-acetylglucosamine-6-phosphate deacetylase
MEIKARRYDNGLPIHLEIEGSRIVRAKVCPGEHERAAAWPWIAPGLLDIQINGYGGQEFSSPSLTAEKVITIVDAMAAFGVTRFCPTVTTEGFEVLRHAMATLREVAESSPDLAWRLPCVHLEGPYITKEDGARGAHPLAHCRLPDWDEFQRLQEAAGGRIGILTMSVEHPGSPEFVARVAATGVVVAIGHTAATADQVHAAIDAGARLGTHLGNGAHPILQRHPNYIWAQLADDRLTASIISDGHHLPPDVVKTFVRAKTAKRCILVSDLSGLAGLPPGRYSSNLCEIEILDDGRLVVAGQRKILAGASRPLSVCVGNVMSFAGVSLADAISMATSHPAELLGIQPGDLLAGDEANLVLFDLVVDQAPCAVPQFVPKTVVARGQAVFGSL